jgi:hypothetical protein
MNKFTPKDENAGHVYNLTVTLQARPTKRQQKVDGLQIYVFGDRHSSFLFAAFIGSSVPGPYSQTAAHG